MAGNESPYQVAVEELLADPEAEAPKGAIPDGLPGFCGADGKLGDGWDGWCQSSTGQGRARVARHISPCTLTPLGNQDSGAGWEAVLRLVTRLEGGCSIRLSCGRPRGDMAGEAACASGCVPVRPGAARRPARAPAVTSS